MSDVYSAYKALYFPEKMGKLHRGEMFYPEHVELILSDWCNQNCAFCAYRMDGYTSNQLFQIEKGQTRKARNPKRMIDTEKTFEILSDCKDMGVGAVQFTGGGEPTVHPGFAAIFSYAADLGIQTGLVTNGTMLVDDAIRESVLQARWVRVSVDAATPEFYAQERDVGVGMWDRVEEGMKRLVKNKPKDLVLGVGFVVTPRSYLQIYDAVKLYKEWGADNVRIGAMFNPQGSAIYKDCAATAAHLARKAKADFSDENFTVTNRFDEKLEELDEGHPDFDLCSYQYFTTYIGADLNVYRCCVYAYNERGRLGSIEHQGLKVFWEADATQMRLKDFNPRACSVCQFTKIIKGINSHLGQPLPEGQSPLHASFV